MPNLNRLEITLLSTEKSARGPRDFRKTYSPWGIVETDYGPINYESSLEQSFLYMMLADPQTTNISHQPIQINFQVTGSPRLRRYTPDYMIERDTKMPWVWGKPENQFQQKLLAEVKPYAKLAGLSRSAGERHTAGQLWAKQNDAIFRVLTERFIDPVAVRNARSIVAVSDGQLPGWLKHRPILDGPVQIVDVFRACTQDVQETMAAHFLYLGLARRWFWCPLNLRMSLTTIVYPY